MNHTFAPTMPTTMATSDTVHHGPTARWSTAITRPCSASATAMPSVTIAPQMPGRIPGARAKGVRQVLTGSTDPADGATCAKTERLDAAGQPRGSRFLAPAAHVQGERTPAYALSRPTSPH